jgi:hypothetical protein
MGYRSHLVDLEQLLNMRSIHGTRHGCVRRSELTADVTCFFRRIAVVCHLGVRLRSNMACLCAKQSEQTCCSFATAGPMLGTILSARHNTIYFVAAPKDLKGFEGSESSTDLGGSERSGRKSHASLAFAPQSSFWC